jgi:hypothetical protein
LVDLVEDASGSGPEESPIKSRTRKKPRVASISTAKLQQLLPRRRTNTHKETDEYDVPDSDEVEVTNLDSDQDELQLPSRRHAPRRHAPTARKPPPKATKRSGKNAKKDDPTMSGKHAKSISRTYGRRTSSDKENDTIVVRPTRSESPNEVDESTEITGTAISRVNPLETKALAKKFEEVDAWEMDFESVDVEGESSPWR